MHARRPERQLLFGEGQAEPEAFPRRGLGVRSAILRGTRREGVTRSSVDIRGRYYINPEFAVQVKMNLGSDFETIAIGVRGEFGGGTVE